MRLRRPFLVMMMLAGAGFALDLPVNIPGTSAALPGMSHLAVDPEGNAFIPLQLYHIVVRLDAASGILTLVAGTGISGFGGDDGPATGAQLNTPTDVALDSAGNLYIADYLNGRIRKVSNGVITTVAGGGHLFGENIAASDALLAPSLIAVDSAGSLFIASLNQILKVSNGVVVAVAGNGTWGFSGDGGPATSAQFYGLAGLAVDAAGNIYIADGNNNRIRKVSNGVITTVAGTGVPGFSGDNGPATSAGLSYPLGIALDFAGNLFIADQGNNRIRKVSNGVITTVAGSGAYGFGGDGGPATDAQLGLVSGVAVDSAGNLLIVDGSNQRIRKVSNGVITTVAGNGKQPTPGLGDYTISTFAGGDNGPATSAQSHIALGFVTGVAIDSKGNIFIALYDRETVVRLDAATGILTVVAGNGSAGYSGDNGPATSAQLHHPEGVKVDSSGNLYIAEYDNACVRKVSGGVITTVAGTGTPGFSGDNGPATSAQLAHPTRVALDAAGNLYIADSGNSRIRKVTKGVITTVAGNGTNGFGGDNGPATSAQLNGPSGLAVDSAGNLFITDGGSRIRKVSSGVITTVAGNGKYGFSGDGVAAINAQLYLPSGLALDSAGNLYIADTINCRVRKVSSGVITTVAGDGSNSFGGDGGPAVEGQLGRVFDVALDSAGNLYIAGPQSVRKVSGGVLSTVAGNPLPLSAGFSGDNGPATSAQLNGPTGVAVDAAGNVYIADVNNNRIRKVSNGVITTVAGTGVPGFSGDNGPATSAQLYHPYRVALDPSGTLYIADNSNQAPGGVYLSRIRRVANGVITSMAVVAAHTALAADATGVYFSDATAYAIRKISGGVTTTAVSPGGIFGGPPGAAIAELDYPWGMALDSAGSLYVADANKEHILKVSGQVVTTVAGNGTAGLSGDGGLATNAQLYSPQDVAVDAPGNLYIADGQYSRVRKVANGIITTIAGAEYGASTADGGLATSAQLTPDGVAVDSAGNVYVADSFANRIRILTPVPCSYSVTPASLQAPALGASLTINIQTATSCAWTITGLPNWISVSGTASGTGPATVTLTIAANGGAARSATITVAGVSVPVAQDAFGTDPPAQLKVVSGSGQSGSPGSTLGNPLVVQVLGRSGAALAGVPVAFSVASGSATLSAASVQTAPDGTAGVSVTLGAAAGPVVVTAAVTGLAAVKFQVTVNSQPRPTVNDHGVVSLVSAQSPLAPGGLASIYGSNFTLPGLAFYGLPSADPLNPSGPLSVPTSLGGVTVSMGGRAVPLLFVSPSQINFQVPYDTPNGSANLTVTAGNTSSLPAYFGVFQTAPIILVYGDNWAVAQNQDYSVNAADNPAKVGDFITVYGTAAGAVNPAVPTGQAAPVSPLSTVADVTVTIRGAPAKVTFAGLTPGFVGLLQVNLQVPALPDGAYPIQISVGNYKSNAPTIAVTH